MIFVFKLPYDNGYTLIEFDALTVYSRFYFYQIKRCPDSITGRNEELMKKVKNIQTESRTDNPIVNKEDLLSVSKIAKLIGISETKIRYDCKNGKLNCTGQGVMKIKVSDAYKYQEREINKKSIGRIVDFDLRESFRFLPAFTRTHTIINPKTYRGNVSYAIGNNGTIVNTGRMNVLKHFKSGNGHYQVKLFNRIQPTVQQLVALMWCPNAKHKSIVHHIDGNKTNNHYTNLIWVTYEQHGIATSYQQKIKKSILDNPSESAKLQEEYLVLIKTIQEENSEEFEDLRIIPHLDFGADESLCYYMYVTEESYQKYQSSGNESDLVIKGEGAF